MPLYSKSVKFFEKVVVPLGEFKERKTLTRRGNSAAWRSSRRKVLYSKKIIKPVFTSDVRSALPMAVAPKCMFDYS